MNKYDVLSFGAAGITVFLVEIFSTPEFPEHRLLPLATLGVISFLVVRLCFRRNPVDVPVTGVATLLWVYFQLPLFWSELPRRISRVDPAPFLDSVVLIGSLGVIGFVAGYYFLLANFRNPPIFSTSARLSGGASRKLAFALLAIGLVYRIADLEFHFLVKVFGQIIAVFDYFILLGCGLALRLHVRRQLTLELMIFALMMFALDTLVTIYSTLLARFAYSCIGLVTIYVLETKRVPKALIVVLLLLFLPLYANRKLHRGDAVARWSSGRQASIVESIVGGYEYAVDSFGEKGTERVADDQDKIVNKEGVLRMENVTFLAQCVCLVEGGKPLKLGQTFWHTPLAPIPRIIFPWKPRNTHCSLLANEYRVRNPNSRCAINFPWLVEWYVNFGAAGAFFGCGAMGAFIAFAFSKADFGRYDLNMLVFLNLLWWLVKVESDIPMVVGGMLQTLLIWYFIRYLLQNGVLPGIELSKANATGAKELATSPRTNSPRRY